MKGVWKSCTPSQTPLFLQMIIRLLVLANDSPRSTCTVPGAHCTGTGTKGIQTKVALIEEEDFLYFHTHICYLVEGAQGLINQRYIPNTKYVCGNTKYKGSQNKRCLDRGGRLEKCMRGQPRWVCTVY